MIDLRPLLDAWPVEVTSRRERRRVGNVTDLAPGLEDDAAANRSMAEGAERGWFNRELEGSFPFDYYWDSPNEMQEFIEAEWEDFVGISDEVWRRIRSEWAVADADARLRVRVKMLITRWKRQN